MAAENYQTQDGISNSEYEYLITGAVIEIVLYCAILGAMIYMTYQLLVKENYSS
jgi:hypothetical protein